MSCGRQANPLNYVSAVRDLVQRADPRLPLSDVKSQSARIDQTINQEITFARLCTAFALLALVIACVGPVRDDVVQRRPPDR